MNRWLLLLAVVAVSSTGCGMSMSGSPMPPPGCMAIHRTIDERGMERAGIDFDLLD